MYDDGVWTFTIGEQNLLENNVKQLRLSLLEQPLAIQDEKLRLKRDQTVGYLHFHFQRLPALYVALDASRAWMVYWIVHSLALLKAPLPEGVTREGKCRALEIASFVRLACSQTAVA
jgi:protein farnesyltransferase subunit beta